MSEENELEIVVMSQVQDAMDSDPELAAMLRECLACAHQANEAVQSGRYETFEDALEAITGSRPVLLVDEDEGDA